MWLLLLLLLLKMVLLLLLLLEYMQVLSLCTKTIVGQDLTCNWMMADISTLLTEYVSKDMASMN